MNTLEAIIRFAEAIYRETAAPVVRIDLHPVAYYALVETLTPRRMTVEESPEGVAHVVLQVEGGACHVHCSTAAKDTE